MVSLCEGVITNLNVAVNVNSVNKTLVGGRVIDRAIEEAWRPRLLSEYRKLNGCEIGKCKVTLGCKLPVNLYVWYCET